MLYLAKCRTFARLKICRYDLSSFLIANCNNCETNKVRYTPVVFVERGLYMLAKILKSEQAIGDIFGDDMANDKTET